MKEELTWMKTKAKARKDTLRGKASAREASLRAETSTLHAQATASHGSLLLATIYMCSNAINPLATSEAIELISLDFPDVNVKRPDYGYDKAVRKESGWRLVEAMLHLPEFSLLESLKSSDHILMADEVLKSKVDKDKMFLDLDKS